MKKQLFSLLLISLGFLTYGQNEITLISLNNKDTIDYKNPVFNWSYTNIPQPRDDFKYDFVLVELKDNQSAAAGISVNQPILRINGIQGFQLVYPFDAPELKFGKTYGWQIQKIKNNIIVDKSEAWEFTLYKKVKIPMKYALLSTASNSTIYNTDDKGFFFKLRSRYKQIKPLRIVVLDKDLHPVKVNMGQDKKMGLDDRLEKTSTGYHFLKTDGYSIGIYTLKVTDSKGNVYSTMFKVN